MGILDEKLLEEKGFMENDNGTWKMKDINNIMYDNVSKEDHPTNILHLFQTHTKSDFEIEDLKDLEIKGINFIFALKHKNEGKINSMKWFSKGICNYLKPTYSGLLDIGTVVNHDALYTLFKYMVQHPTCGGCCGEIEVEMAFKERMASCDIRTYLIEAM